MTNPIPAQPVSKVNADLDRKRAADILRGVQRRLAAQHFESLAEVSLGNGRRADVMAIGPGGDVWIVEIKSSIADFRSDHKWPHYQDYCDALFFAVGCDFPSEILPAEAGLIVADAFGGDIIRMPGVRPPLAAARRKSLTLSFARIAAMRFALLRDPANRDGHLLGE
jgi:hypothetical protein